MVGKGKLPDGSIDAGRTISEDFYDIVEENIPGQQDNQVHIKHLESDNYGGKNGGEKAATVWAILHGFANNKDCVDAYKALKVAEGGKQEKIDGVDIVGMLSNNFINVGTSNFFSSNSDARIGQETGLNQNGVSYFRGSSGGQARTNAHKEDFMGKVIPTIILSDELFDKKGPTLAQVLAHELIHGGGIRGKDPTRSAFLRGRGNGPGDPSDLDFLGKAYDNVIKTCVDGLPDNLKK